MLYEKILHTLRKIPENSGYRKYTEQIVNEKLSIVKSVSNVHISSIPSGLSKLITEFVILRYNDIYNDPFLLCAYCISFVCL